MLVQPFADPGRPDLRSPWRFLRWLIGEQRRTVVSGAAFGVAWMVSQAAIPALLGRAVEDIVRQDRAGVVRWSVVLLALGVIQAAAGVLRHRRAVANFVVACTRVEQLLSRAASRLGPRLSDEVAAGEVANLGGADVERIGELLDVSARFSGAVVSYAGVTVVLIVTSPLLGVVVAAGAAGVVAVIGPLLRPLEHRQTVERDRRAAASSLAADTVVGLRILRGLGGEAVFADRFGRASQDVRHAAVRTAGVQSYLDATQVALPQALTLAVTWLGAHLVLHHHLDPGQLVSVYAYAAFLLLPVQTLVEASSRATSASVAAGRVVAVLRLDDDVPDEPTSRGTRGPGTPPENTAPMGPSLVDPSTGLVVPLGRMTAVVTPTPEACAALVDRLGRWVDPPADLTVTLAGAALGSLPLAEVRRRILVVDRDATLLAGPLADLLEPASEPRAAEHPVTETPVPGRSSPGESNSMRSSPGESSPGPPSSRQSNPGPPSPGESSPGESNAGPPSSRQSNPGPPSPRQSSPAGAGVGVSLDAALEAAAATEIVASLPEGLRTVLPERGRSLSGGQRQRILLAQALVADPEILVLDEPTSAVDAHTEASIGAGLAHLRRGRTTVVCTTSPLLLTHADLVALVDGTVVATGTHAELLASSRRYREIVTRGSADGGDGDGCAPPVRDT